MLVDSMTLSAYLEDETGDLAGLVRERNFWTFKLQTRPPYQDLLERLYGFWMPLESRLLSSKILEQSGFQVRASVSMSLLQDDLFEAGLNDESLDRLALSPWIPELKSFEQELGALFALERLAYEARNDLDLILQNAESLLPFEHHYYFRSLKARSQSWPAFAQILDALEISQDQVGRAVWSVCQTYEYLDRWLKSSVAVVEAKKREPEAEMPV